MTNNYLKASLYYLGWLVLFAFTPGLISSSFGIAGLFNQSEELSTLINSGFMLLIFLILALTNWQQTKSFFTNNLSKNKSIIILTIIVLSLITLPFHYKMPFNVSIYAFWMFSSVVWQNFVSFGVFYSKLRELFSENVTQLLVTLAFASGHVIYIWQKFGFGQPISLIFILVVALILSSFRRLTGNISWQIAIHLAFYYLLS